MTKKILKPKIWFLATWYPTPIDPLRGVFIKRHAKAISSHADITVLHIYSIDKPGWFGFQTSITKHNGFSEILIRTKAPALPFLKIIAFLLGLLKGYKFLKKESDNPDLVHVNVLTRMGLLAYFLKKRKKTPYIITEHWSRYQKGNSSSYNGYLRKWITKKIISDASQITTVTAHLARAMKDCQLHNTYSVIPNVVDTQLFVISKINKETGIFKLIHISSFYEKAKNIRNLLDAVNIARQSNSSIRLNLVGDGHDFKMIKTYAENIPGHNEFITFTGILTGEELSKAIQNSNALIISSDYENLPCVIPEAMSCGLPVISTDVGGISEHISMQYGILVTPGDKKVLSNAILKMAGQIDIYDSTNIRKYAVDHFSMAVIGQNFSDIYQKVISKK